jgi:hypothetical protein
MLLSMFSLLDTILDRTVVVGYTSAGYRIRRTTIVWLGAATAPGRSSGLFWHDRVARPTYLLPWTKEGPEDRARLWEQCEQMTGWHADDAGPVRKIRA